MKRITESKAKQILKRYNLRLWRAYGRWFACRPTEGPAFADASAKTLRELLEKVAPPEDLERLGIG